MATRKPKWTQEWDGGDYRVVVYATRNELECVVNGNIDDPNADVWCFPKVIGAVAAAHQAYLNQKGHDKAKAEATGGN